jgi:hypothetical protein
MGVGRALVAYGDRQRRRRLHPDIKKGSGLFFRQRHVRPGNNQHSLAHIPDAGKALAAGEVPCRHPAEERGSYPPLPAAMARAAAYAVENAAWRL